MKETDEVINGRLEPCTELAGELLHSVRLGIEQRLQFIHGKQRRDSDREISAREIETEKLMRLVIYMCVYMYIFNFVGFVIALIPPLMAHSPPLAGGLVLLLLFGAAIYIPRCLLATHPHFEGLDDASDAVLDDDHFDYEPSIPSPPISVSSHEPPSDPLPPPRPNPIADSELCDEDEVEGIPILNSISYPPGSDPDQDLVQAPAPCLSDAPKPCRRFSGFYVIEFMLFFFLISFIVNSFAGTRKNERIVLAWVSKYGTRNSIFSKNFCFLGTSDGKYPPFLLRQRPDVFKIWATGKKHCKGFIATLDLKKRHNLISRIWDTVLLKRDTITFEVVMNDNAMDHVVLSVVRSKASKAMVKEARDLQRFASVLAWTPAGGKRVSKELAIVAESKEIARDLITEFVVDQVLGEKVFEQFRKDFISLHFSDQYPGSHSKMLIFKFALPDAKNMADMIRLVSLVPYYVNLIGRYKVSSQARSKTDPARLKAAKENARREALQKQKEEQRKLMDEADGKLSANARLQKECRR